MTKIKFFFAFFLIAITAEGADTQSAIQFMQTLGDQVIFTTKTKYGEEKRQELKKIFEANVHHTSIAKFVLGKARRALRLVFKEAEDIEKDDLMKKVRDSLEEFYKTYKKSITRVYLASFDRDYKDEVFKATHAKKDGDGGVIVYSTLDRKNGAPPLNLHWILKRAEDDWKIVDLRVEGVSQAEKERDETTSIIRKHKNKCQSDGLTFCDLVALQRLTQDHKKLNAEWKRKMRGESATE